MLFVNNISVHKLKKNKRIGRVTANILKKKYKIITLRVLETCILHVLWIDVTFSFIVRLNTEKPKVISIESILNV